MKNQKSTILFVRATGRKNVIAVELHRQAIFGLGFSHRSWEATPGKMDSGDLKLLSSEYPFPLNGTHLC